MAIYVLNPDGSINKDGTTIPTKQGYQVAKDALGDFKSARNYAENSHEVFDAFDNSNPIPNESLPDLNNLANPSNSGIIGQTDKLYPYAFGKNMDFTPTTEKLPFYKPYNSFFDLDFSDGQRDNENLFQIFADEVDFYGVPAILSDTSNTVVDFANVFSSLADMLLGAILPITVMSALQGILQAAQGGPPDPFALFGKVHLVEPNRLGSFINYVRIDTSEHNFIGPVFNAIIDSLVSLLKATERLMNFPSTPLKEADFFQAVGSKILENTLSFLVGYIYYLIPGFKIEDPILSTNPATAIGNLFSSLLSLVFANKAKHNYNLLIYKIVKNNYFRSNIQFKAKTIEKGNETYDYNSGYLALYPLSDFFHRFIGQRVAVGQKVLGSLTSSYYNKRNNIFAVQKMNELPVQKKDDDDQNLPIPLSMGSSILGKKDDNDATEISGNYFKKSIYSLTSLVTKTSTANTYLKYHNELVKQNQAIYQNKERRLSREHVQKIEEIINSDYMPFSIQDLRTNEVFKFHAFLENYADSFQVNWDDGGVGFGRMDPIKTYKGTTRSISTDFWLVSMSPDDFDYMWWMINRLIALIYPQWSAPRAANIENQSQAGMYSANLKKHFGIPFSQPFTQIPTGSPLVRLRLGDLFTSNYSKKSLARIFGFELESLNQVNVIEKKKNEIIAMIQDQQSPQIDYLSNIEILGYDYFDLDDYRSQLNKDTYMFNRLDQVDFYPINDLKDDFKINVKKTESSLGDIQKLFKEYSNFYYDINNDPINLDDINAPKSTNNENKDRFFPENRKEFKKLIYIPLTVIQDDEEKILMLLTAVSVKVNDSSYKQESFIKDVATIFKNKIMNNLNYSSVATDIQDNTRIDKLKNVQNLKSFMTGKGELAYDEKQPFDTTINPGTENAMNNPVVYSFESTMGEGIAGTIQTFNINFDQNIPWELNEGSRAPIAVKISLGLSVIHDILPGLDDKGIMRAPTYRVGKINREFFGESVYDDLPVNMGYSNPNPVVESPQTTQNNPASTSPANNTEPPIIFGVPPLFDFTKK